MRGMNAKPIISLLGKWTGNYLAGNVAEILEGSFCVADDCPTLPLCVALQRWWFSNVLIWHTCNSEAGFAAKAAGSSKGMQIH